MNDLASVTTVVPLADFHARVTFSDGTTRDINLLPYIDVDGVFTPIRDDPAFFRAMTVENDTISWPNGADIDPDVLYLGLPPHATEEQWRAALAARSSAEAPLSGVEGPRAA
jgi:Protein of unknown function (DUF2442)